MRRYGGCVVFVDFNYLFVVFSLFSGYKVPDMTVDKRDVGDVFRERLGDLADRYGGNQAAFARAIGLDRSALRQLMVPGSTRLPRAETLCRIAERHSVSLDWLLGLSQSDSVATEISTTLEIEEAADDRDDTRLNEWHREAIGYKIRYVPKTLPDPLRLQEVILYEHSPARDPKPLTLLHEADSRLAYTRRPETDVEVCMSRQALEQFARGEGIWKGLAATVRQRQLEHMLTLLDELYPTFRLFLFDATQAYSAPYTVFGPMRAAIYMGQMYLVVNSVEHIAALTRHFDLLIRAARDTPVDSPRFVQGLLDVAT